MDDFSAADPADIKGGDVQVPYRYNVSIGATIVNTKSLLMDTGYRSVLTGAQIRMARAALGWGVRDLAAKAGTTPNTVSRIEGGGEALAGTLSKMQAALEGAGIEFIAGGPYTGDGGPGVRLRKDAPQPGADGR